MFLTTIVLGLIQAAAPAHATTSTVATAAIELHGHAIAIEVAADAASREHGLMNRKELAPGHGMLFVFPNDAPRSFWMKNTLIPLDILFFDRHATLVSMQLNVPPCTHDPCPTYASNADARYVLELPGGAAGRLGLENGDTMSLPPTPIVAH